MRAFVDNPGPNTPETLADTIQPLLRHGLVPATAGNDLLILDATANQVMRLACANASIVDITATLATHGLLATTSGHAVGRNISTPELSRRRMLQGTAAAGVIGVTVLTLPTAAMAASVKPDAPSGVVATAGDTQVIVGWNLVIGATDYEVFYRLQTATDFTRFEGPVTTSDTMGSAQVVGLLNSLTYEFYIVALAGTTRSVPSDTITATPTPDEPAPAAASGVTATSGPQSTEVTVSWDPVDGATSYEVSYKSTGDTDDENNWVTPGVGVSATSLTVAGLTNGTSYDFRVVTTANLVQSPPSAVVTATPVASMPLPPTDPESVGTVTVATGENRLRAAVIVGTFGYFGTNRTRGQSQSQVVKVNLTTMKRVGEVTLADGEVDMRAAVTDGTFGYFGTDTSPGRVVKVRLSDIGVEGATPRVDALTLDVGENSLLSAVTDGTFGYFGTNTQPGRVVKVKLSDMTRVGAVALASLPLPGESNLVSAVTDGTFGYFGTNNQPGRVVKVKLADIGVEGETPRVGVVALSTNENSLNSAVAADGFGYFGTFTSPGRVVKVNLTTMNRVGEVTLNAGESNLVSAVTDGTFGYFGTRTSPGRVVKVRLSDMTRVGALTLPQGIGENDLLSAVTDGTFGYFGTDTTPGRVVKVALAQPAVSAPG